MHQTRRRTVTARKTPRRLYQYIFEQPEDPAPTPEETRAVLMLFRRSVDLILSGEESIRDLFIPAGGWDRLDREHPDFKALPVEAQLRFILRR
jgi:hypothetical protein